MCIKKTHNEFSRRTYSFETLQARYWHKRFHNHGYPHYQYMIHNLMDSSNEVIKRLNLNEHDLIKGDNQQCYYIENHTKRSIYNGEVFFNHEWEFSWVKKISDYDLSFIRDGPEIDK